MKGYKKFHVTFPDTIHMIKGNIKSLRAEIDQLEISSEDITTSDFDTEEAMKAIVLRTAKLSSLVALYVEFD